MQTWRDWWDWFACWPWGKCMWCGKRFWRGFAWGLTVEFCSRECADRELDWCDQMQRGCDE